MNLVRHNRKLWLAERAAQVGRASSADLRDAGWMVAVHNDYRLAGDHFTFWLMTKGDRCVKGEGSTDAEALNEIRRKAKLPQIPLPPECPGKHCPLCNRDRCLAHGDLTRNGERCDHDVLERHGEGV